MNLNKKMLSVALISASVTFSSAVFAQDQLRVGTEGAYAPWNYIDTNGNIAGYDIDLANLICEKINMECVFVTNEWDSIIPNLVAGNYDAIIAAMTITAERSKTISFSEEYYPPDPSAFVGLKGVSENFSGLRIGVQGGTVHREHLNEPQYAGNEILSYETGDQAMSDLINGNVDYVLADKSYLKSIVDQSKGMLVFVGDEAFLGGGIGIGLRKKDALLKLKINNALAKLKADGSVDQLINQYFQAGPFYQ